MMPTPEQIEAMADRLHIDDDIPASDMLRTIAAEMRKSEPSADEVAKDAERYSYILDCEVIAAKKYLPNMDEDTYKAGRRSKHDWEIAQLRKEASHG